MYYDLHKATGTAANGDYIATGTYPTPGPARKEITAKLKRRGGGRYELLSRLARGTSAPGMWSGGECGTIKTDGVYILKAKFAVAQS